MIQKLLSVGSSKAVTVPKNALKELGLEGAESVSVTIDAKNRQLIVEPVQEVNGELVSWTRGFIDKYRPALEALSKK